MKNRETKRVAASVDLTEGPLLKRIILYTLPIIATGVLQLLFNAADLVVVGNSKSETAIAAVGSTGALCNLIVNLLIGLSVGAGVVAARLFGSRDEKGLHDLVHTAVPTALIGGIVFGGIGCAFGGTFLKWMNTPDDVIEQATLYIRIYCAGVPFMIVYNFGAAILRSVGDTVRPLIFLVSAGVLNVALNCFLVFAFGMDVAGVAIATVASQVVSVVLVLGYMMRIKEGYRFRFREMHFYKDKFVQIAVIGLPAGIQGSVISISNVLIQSSINGFGSAAIAGASAASNIEGFVYQSMNAFYQAAIGFVGQHVGAKKYGRIKRVILLCTACVTVTGIVLGGLFYLLGRPLLHVYIPNNETAIDYGMIRLSLICLPYFLCGVMDVFSGGLRGMGYSVTSMVNSLVCMCGLRVVWIYTVFRIPKLHTFPMLFLSYLITWIVCGIAQGVFLLYGYRKVTKSQ